MSTFDGRVAEFPDIRIDFFRPSPADKTPALAYFLSHVHSDHLQGLETCKSPFIYCSAATREILLRLEKYPHRMNFARGILEARRQTYRHLNKLLKAVALETPTMIELAPGREVRVTLFDANHCVGAVMFLIEGDGKAVLYTGDVRSELWWVNNLTRQPSLIPYAASVGQLKVLDCVYLDTTFVVTGREDPHVEFPPKADGLRELLQKVSRYPEDTFFYLDAWTFGYEDVWTALSGFLRSPIHVDDYRYGVYGALANGSEPKAPETSKLMGVVFGNRYQHGCLTSDSKVRIHSCEQGTGCKIWSEDFVRITPIVTRHNGKDYVEAGAGGGQGDLNLQHELEMHDISLVTQLISLCILKLSGQPQLLESVIQMISSVVESGAERIKLDCFSLFEQDEMEELSIEKLIPALSKIVTKAKLDQKRRDSSEDIKQSEQSAKRPDGLMKQIRFPYSRHSSYAELCHLVEAFKPQQIHPCTVDDAHWSPSFSMSALFGHLYDGGGPFRHDILMTKKKGLKLSEVGDALKPLSTPNSRPESRMSSTSDYATPYSNQWLTHVYNVLKAQDGQFNEMKSKSMERLACSDREDSSKRFKAAGRAHGDLWPPFERDHDSPPAEARKRRPSETLTPRKEKKHVPDNDPSASNVARNLASYALEDQEPTLKKRTSHRPELPPEWQFEDEHTASNRILLKSSKYGRLSPPPPSPNKRKQIGHSVAREVKDSDAILSEGTPQQPRMKSEASSELSMLYSPAESRLAFRQEVRDAILGQGERNWADIGLVSTGGYQKKETEL